MSPVAQWLWRRADDVRALLVTCLVRTRAERRAETLHHILDVYGDEDSHPHSHHEFHIRLPAPAHLLPCAGGVVIPVLPGNRPAAERAPRRIAATHARPSPGSPPRRACASSVSDSCQPRVHASGGITSGMPSCTMFSSVPTETFFKLTVDRHLARQVRIVELVGVAKALVRDELEVLAAERVALAGGEVGERHLVRAADSGVHMVNLAGEAVRRQPLGHGVGIEERPVDPLRRRPQHAVETGQMFGMISS